MPFKKRKMFQNDRGEINIVAFAIALPILILLGTVAMDILRYPLTKQQIGSAVESGIDSLILTEDENSSYVDTATGKDWCAILSTNNPRRLCPACDDEEENCTGALDAAAAHAVKDAVSRTFQQLTQSGIGVLSHEGADVNVVGGIYNLVASSSTDKDGLIVGVEEVSKLDASEWGGVLDYEIDLRAILVEKFVSGGETYIGHVLNFMPFAQQSATDVPVAIFGVAVRINNIFNLPADMQFGAPVPESVGGTNAVVVVSTIIRPLPRGFRLSGGLAAASG